MSAAGPQLLARRGELIRLASYTLTPNGYEPKIRYGTLLDVTKTHVRISEDGNTVALDRETWLEVLP